MSEILGFVTRQPKRTTIKKKPDERIIVDEGHEILLYPHKKLDKIYSHIIGLSSKYKWIVSNLTN